MTRSGIAWIFCALILWTATGCGRPSEATVAAEKDELKAYLAENGDDTDANADDGNQ